MAYDLILGRLLLPTLTDDLKEGVGDPLEVEGTGVALGKRRVKPYSFNIPIHGETVDANPYNAGLRLRRQLRSQLQNGTYRGQSLYLNFSPDSELNGWMMIGAGDIEYKDGGVSFGEFQLTLDEIYRVGSPRTHRPARRVEQYDRRLSTTPRDYYGTLFSVDFAALAGLSLVTLPSNVSDLVGLLGVTLTPAVSMATSDGGSVALVPNQVHGSVISFEQPEASRTKGDVIVYDRRGNLGPFGGGTYDTVAGITDPQGQYGWEEAYGPDYPFTATDVPVITNGRCRVRYDASNTPGLKVDAWTGTAWAEQGKVIFQRRGDTTNLLDTLVSATILEYTQDRAAIGIVMKSSADAFSRERIVVLISRGWSGPSLECYAAPKSAGGGADIDMFVVAAAANVNDSILKIDAASAGAAQATAGSGSTSFTGATIGASSFTGENLLAWLREGGALAMAASVVQAANAIAIAASTAAAYGATAKNALNIRSQNGAGYLSLDLGIYTQRADQIMEAESMTLGTGTGSISDAAASNGITTNATRSTDANPHLTRATWPNSQKAKYRVLARVKTTAGTLFIYAKTTTTTGATKTTVSTTYVWVDLGDVIADLSTLEIHAWVSSGGTLSVDRIESFKLEDRTATPPTYDGARDLAQSSLYDTRTIPELVSR